MEINPEMSKEELEKLLEKAQKELQEKLEKMTPGEREQAELRAQQLIEKDREETQSMLDAARAAAGSSAQPQFCEHCGAALGGGNFCAYCGSPVQKN